MLLRAAKTLVIELIGATGRCAIILAIISEGASAAGTSIATMRAVKMPFALRPLL